MVRPSCIVPCAHEVHVLVSNTWSPAGGGGLKITCCSGSLSLAPYSTPAFPKTCNYNIYVSYLRVPNATVASLTPGLYSVMCCVLRKTAVLDEDDKG